MPSYNASQFIKDAIDSILVQTYRDFELVLINDGSNDNTEKIIQSFSDDRIKYIHVQKNQGVASSLNLGLSISIGEYIARMDADDIALPERMQTQITFLDNNPQVLVCGTAVLPYVEGKVRKPFPIKTNPLNCLLDAYFSHPSVMMRRELFDNETLRYQSRSEDLYFWNKIFSHYNYDSTIFYNLPTPLLLYRIHNQQITHQQSNEFIQAKQQTRRYFLDRFFNIVGIEFRFADINQLETKSFQIFAKALNTFNHFKDYSIDEINEFKTSLLYHFALAINPTSFKDKLTLAIGYLKYAPHRTFQTLKLIPKLFLNSSEVPKF